MFGSLERLTLSLDRFSFIFNNNREEIVLQFLIFRTGHCWAKSSKFHLNLTFSSNSYSFRSSSNMRWFSSGRLQCRMRPDQNSLPVFFANLQSIFSSHVLNFLFTCNDGFHHLKWQQNHRYIEVYILNRKYCAQLTKVESFSSCSTIYHFERHRLNFKI